jgi:hypothetical protein
MKMNKDPKQIVNLLMAFLAALQQGQILALWTTHAKKRSGNPDRNIPVTTKKAAEANRPVVLEVASSILKPRWYLSFDKEGVASIAINDSLYGAMFLAYNDGTWLIKSVIARQHYKRTYEAVDLEFILGLTEQYNSAVVEETAEEEPVVEETAEDEHKMTREEAHLRISKYQHKVLLNLRKHLGITGNVTGKRGAVSTENAIESILQWMDTRDNYELNF